MSETIEVGRGAEGENKHIALMISVLALLLALSEILGQRSMTESLQHNIEASNLWAFYQAKTIRKTVAETAADELETNATGAAQQGPRAVAITARIAALRATAQRMETDPEGGEGRVELTAKAKAMEGLRDRATRRHERLELASGAFQIAIVLGSATIITGVLALFWIAGGLGGLGLIMLIAGVLT